MSTDEGFVALTDLFLDGQKMYSVGASVSDEVVERFGWRSQVVRPGAKSAEEAREAAAGAGIPTPVPQDNPDRPKDTEDLEDQHEQDLDHSTKDSKKSE
jgi:hypothetical protein